MPDLHDRVILITGGNRGQGKAIGEHLASLGAKVIIGARRYQDAETAASLIGAYPVKLDVTKEDEWKCALTEIQSEFGQLDALVNNAGILKENHLQIYR